MTLTKEQFKDLTIEQIYIALGTTEDTRGSITKAIIQLTDIGFSRMEISKMLGKRYQHVRNVLEDQKLKKRK